MIKVCGFSHKICIVCEKEYRPTGTRQKACKECKEAFRKASMPDWLKNHRANDVERNKKYQREYFRKHPERYTYWSAKGRARKNNISFDLEFSDIVYPKVCPILSIPIERNAGHKSYSGRSPSLDRIDPKKGYTKGNVQVISQKANVMKNDATPEELILFADWVYRTYKSAPTR